MCSDVGGRFRVSEGDVDGKGLQLVAKGKVGEEGGSGDGDFAARVDGLAAQPRLQSGDDEVVCSDESVGFAGEGVDEVSVRGAGGAAVGAGEEQVGWQRLEEVGSNEEAELGVGKGGGLVRWEARKGGGSFF